MVKEKLVGKLPAIKVRAMYHRPTEEHRNAKAYRRKGREAVRILREYQDGSLFSSFQATKENHLGNHHPSMGKESVMRL